jgi:hypothetical protein
MSLRIAKAAVQVEQQDDFHLARLLIMLNNFDEMGTKAYVEGITKLAKLDFLLRYPLCLERVIQDKGKKLKQPIVIPENEINTIESKMIRFRYGPWDERYRRWISILVSKGLISAFHLKITPLGKGIATSFCALPEFEELNRRSKIVVQLVGNMAATALKNYVYKIVPEITSMKWGNEINLLP